MKRRKPAVPAQGAVQELVEAVYALSDDPSRENVERYLASSRALEGSRRRPAESSSRSRSATAERQAA